jgi:hypothetical protein
MEQKIKNTKLKINYEWNTRVTHYNEVAGIICMEIETLINETV